jgi:hypothetical protein
VRIKWRDGGGRFSRAESLEQSGDVKICPQKPCGKIIVKAAGKFPDVCPRCGKELGAP